MDRLQVLLSLGGFSELLGRKGDTLLSNEESMLQDIIRSRGYHCFYHPGIIVRHRIPSERLTKEWILKRNYWQGISEARSYMIREKVRFPGRFALAMRKGKDLLKNPGSLKYLFLPADDPAQFTKKCGIYYELGVIRGLLKGL